ncbi:MAG: hypothetical protein KDD94_00870 [Calditrichaeota bacterium]|nr:hypothetical protein [Calditrichota bacterium]
MVARIGKHIDRKQLGKELKDLIFAKGYVSLYDFHQRAAQDHISYTALKAVIAGQVEPSISAISNIADALEIDPIELFKRFSFKRLS